jgi:uncharacterized protein DUF4013
MKKLDFKYGFKYPFNRAKGMWNILWIFLPIIGWFVLSGYGIRIVQEFSNGKFEKLPILEFKSDLKLGFFMFIKILPFIIIYAIINAILNKISSPVMNITNFFLGLFVLPMLIINFFNKKTVDSLFEFKIIKSVFDNLEDYIVALAKDILLGLIFFVMWIVLIGLPAGTFAKNIFLADFYRRKIKTSTKCTEPLVDSHN